MITPFWFAGSLRPFSYSLCVYFCHLFLIASASLMYIMFLSFIVLIFAWNIPLASLIFLKRSLVFLILLFPPISLHCSLKNAFYLSLLFSGTMHSDGYIFPFLLCLSCLFFSQLFVWPPQTTVLSCWISVGGMVLVSTFSTLLQISVLCSSCTLSVRSNPLTLFVTFTIKS